MRAGPLALVSASLYLLLGTGLVGLGVQLGLSPVWGLGAACLLQVPSSLSLWGRIRAGLGNRGLDRERRTLRGLAVLQRLLALGMLLTAASAWMGESLSPTRAPWLEGLAILSLSALGGLWLAKKPFRADHPSLAQDAARNRTLVELACLLLGGALLAHAVPWALPLSAVAMAARLFAAGRTLAAGTTLQPGGGCGTGCSCG